MKIATIFGTRPEIIKLSALMPLFDKWFDQILIHTGQHYSYQMDKIFFEELNLRNCDYTLNVGSGTHAQQTSKMLILLEEVLMDENPDLVIVQGDTNSTLAGALVASKLQIPVVHIEAGCRSFDRSMPEEINRIIVDHIASYLFAPDKTAFNNLVNEGVTPENIYLVGNTSIDASIRAMGIFNQGNLPDLLENEKYILLTLHRQENTSFMKLNEIIGAINIISEKIKVLFPAHLRTRKVMVDHNMKISNNVILTEPLGYKDFMGLMAHSEFVMTDSGGIQEESAVLNIPCLILRENTEWMEYVESGKNILIGTNKQKIIDIVFDLIDNEPKLTGMKQIQVPIKEGASKLIVSTLKNFKFK